MEIRISLIINTNSRASRLIATVDNINKTELVWDNTYIFKVVLLWLSFKIAVIKLFNMRFVYLYVIRVLWKSAIHSSSYKLHLITVIYNPNWLTQRPRVNWYCARGMSTFLNRKFKFIPPIRNHCLFKVTFSNQ